MGGLAMNGEALRALAKKRGFGEVGDKSYDLFMENIGSNPNYGLKTKTLEKKPKIQQQKEYTMDRNTMFGGDGKGLKVGAIFKELLK